MCNQGESRLGDIIRGLSAILSSILSVMLTEPFRKVRRGSEIGCVWAKLLRSVRRYAGTQLLRDETLTELTPRRIVALPRSNG